MAQHAAEAHGGRLFEDAADLEQGGRIGVDSGPVHTAVDLHQNVEPCIEGGRALGHRPRYTRIVQKEAYIDPIMDEGGKRFDLIGAMPKA
jgi:hypothetical protein